MGVGGRGGDPPLTVTKLTPPPPGDCPYVLFYLFGSKRTKNRKFFARTEDFFCPPQAKFSCAPLPLPRAQKLLPPLAADPTPTYADCTVYIIREGMLGKGMNVLPTEEIEN